MPRIYFEITTPEIVGIFDAVTIAPCTWKIEIQRVINRLESKYYTAVLETADTDALYLTQLGFKEARADDGTHVHEWAPKGLTC